MRRVSFVFLGMLVLMSGCATIRTSTGTTGYTAAFGKRVYVVRHEKSTKNIDLYIQDALTDIGFAAMSGPPEQMPSDVDIYVTYIDKWTWDLGMYLIRLEIKVYDKKTEALLKSVVFKNSPFHLGNARTWTKNTVNKAFRN